VLAQVTGKLHRHRRKEVVARRKRRARNELL
jgi:hypothetical protein